MSMMPCVRNTVRAGRDKSPFRQRVSGSEAHEVVDHAELLVVVARRSHAAFVLVKDEESTLGRIGLRQLMLAAERLRVGPLDGLAERCCICVTLDLRRLPRDLDRVGLQDRSGSSIVILSAADGKDGTNLEDRELVLAETFTVPLEEVVDPRQKRVVHDPEPLQELGVATELLLEEDLFLRAEPELPMPLDPVQILERRVRVLLRLVFRIQATDRRALKGESLVSIRLVEIARQAGPP